MHRSNFVLLSILVSSSVALADTPRVTAPTKPPAVAPLFTCTLKANAKGPNEVVFKKTGGGETNTKLDVVATVTLDKHDYRAATCGAKLTKVGETTMALFYQTFTASTPYKCVASQEAGASEACQSPQ